MRKIVSIITEGAPDTNEVLRLDHDLRNRRRMVFTTDQGSILLDMPRPVHLRDGDVLALDDGNAVRIEAAAEALIEIRAHDLPALVRIAWHLGNRHLPTQLLGDRLRIRHDHVIADMVSGLGGHCEAIMAPFDPERGAYAEDQALPGAGHHHHHHEDEHHHG
ncbi:urease accessory protein [Sphingomonas sp. YR710]|jgi:urease accessory protein|uniref:urease accessory protein UreE n=1 Tax=Sphingomonas sp. YR710 TaxID=1882773 RepID=UPI00087E6174|nr:urease accessory protein UreE [Sphingomonas sp. YR710]SDD50458.1 urease accessory protein [Sphingomonas sp. YR710]